MKNKLNVFKKAVSALVAFAMVFTSVITYAQPSEPVEYPEYLTIGYAQEHPDVAGKFHYANQTVPGGNCAGYEDYKDPATHYVIIKFTSDANEIAYIRCDVWQAMQNPPDPEKPVYLVRYLEENGSLISKEFVNKGESPKNVPAKENGYWTLDGKEIVPSDFKVNAPADFVWHNRETPQGPTVDEIKSLLKVEVDCERDSAGHKKIIFNSTDNSELFTNIYFDITAETEDVYRVTLNRSGINAFVQKYNSVYGNHTIEIENGKEDIDDVIFVKKINGQWKIVEREGSKWKVENDNFEIDLVCGGVPTDKYTVTYDWGTENVPEGYIPPVDNGSYAKGEKYTVDSEFYKDSIVQIRDPYGNIVKTHKFSGWMLNGKVVSGEQIMGKGNVVLKGIWTVSETPASQLKVTFKAGENGKFDKESSPVVKEGVINSPFPSVPVPVADSGYEFDGWYDKNNNKVETWPEKLTENAEFTAKFKAKQGIKYTVEYYFENAENDNFTLDAKETLNLTGEAGAEVKAEVKTFTGFTFDKDNAGNNLSDNIKGDGSLVLKVYYKRIRHNVTYRINGYVPSDVEEPAVKEYKYGEKVTVLDKPVTKDSEYKIFIGWTTKDVEVVNNEFTMPDKEVLIEGKFVKESYDYTINYHYIGRDGKEVGKETKNDKAAYGKAFKELFTQNARSYKDVNYIFDKAETNNRPITDNDVIREVAADNVIDIYYNVDENKDNVPDKYQAIVTYKAVNGTVNFEKAYVTLTVDGVWSENGMGYLKAEQIPTAAANSGYNQASLKWDVTPTTELAIAKDVTFTVSFTANQVTPPVDPTPTPAPTPTPDTREPVAPIRPVTPDEEEEEEPEATATPTPTPSPTATPEEEIDDTEVPLTDGASWALINLVLAALTVIGGVVMVISYFTGENKSFVKLFGVVPEIVSLVVFLMTEDMSATMVMTDKWTLLMAVITAVQLIAMFLSRRKNEEEEEAE